MKLIEKLKIALNIDKKKHPHTRENARRLRQIKYGIIKVTK